MSADIEVGKSDFDFYCRFAKPLILTLPLPKDRILASAWFAKIKEEGSGDEKLRLDYLKLLLFVLQRRRLAGPFTENPSRKETLEGFGPEYELTNIAREILERERQEKKERCLKNLRGETGNYPPFLTDYSPDLLEYVAAQDIPGFGIHVYYAISRDPLTEWHNSDKGVFPKTPRKVEPLGRVSDTSFAVMEPKHFTKEGVRRPEGDESFHPTTPRGKKMHPIFSMATRPAPALGEMTAEDDLEERAPPTWGSNLIEVKEPVEAEGLDETPPLGVEHEVEGMEDLDDEALQELLNRSINIENVMKEIEAMEEDSPDITLEEISHEEHNIFEKELKAMDEMNQFQDEFDKRIKELEAGLTEDEREMLEAEGAVAIPGPIEKPIAEHHVGDNTDIQLFTEPPKEPKPVKTPGRTGLPVFKARAAVLTPAEKIADAKSTSRPSTSKSGIPTIEARRRKSETAADIDQQKMIELKEAYEEQIKKVEAQLKKLREEKTEEEPSPKALSAADEELQVEHKKISPAEEARRAIQFADQELNESDDIFQEQLREYEALEKLQDIYEKFKDEYPEGGYRSPPLFSRRPEIREIGRQLRYRLNEFNLPYDEKFMDAETFFEEHPDAFPKNWEQMTSEERDEFIMRIQRIRDRKYAEAAEAASQVTPEKKPSPPRTPQYPVADMEHLRKLVERSEKLLAEAPAEAGVPVTSPKPTAVPERPKTPIDLEEEGPPEFPPSPERTPTPKTPPKPSPKPEPPVEEIVLPKILSDEEQEQLYQERKAAGQLEEQQYFTPMREKLKEIREKRLRTPPSVGTTPEGYTPPGRPRVALPPEKWKVFKLESPPNRPRLSPVLIRPGQRTLKEAATLDVPYNIDWTAAPDELLPMEEDADMDPMALATTRAELLGETGLEEQEELELAPFEEPSPQRRHAEVQADDIRAIEAEGEQFIHHLPDSEHAKKYLTRALSTAHEVQTEEQAKARHEGFQEGVDESMVGVIDMGEDEIPEFDVQPEDLDWPENYQDIPQFYLTAEDLGIMPEAPPPMPSMGYEIVADESRAPTGWIPGQAYRPHRPIRMVPAGTKTPPRPPTQQELMNLYYDKEEDPLAPREDEMTLEELTEDYADILVDSPTSRLVATPLKPGSPVADAAQPARGAPSPPSPGTADFRQRVGAAQAKLPKRRPMYRAGRMIVPRYHLRPHTANLLGDIHEHFEGATTVAEMPVKTTGFRPSVGRVPPPRQVYEPPPEELIGVKAPVRFELPDLILDRPIYEEIPSPELQPRGQFGWETPPHLQFLRTVMIDKPWEKKADPRQRLGDYLTQEHMPPELFEVGRYEDAYDEVPDYLKASRNLPKRQGTVPFPEFPDLYAPQPSDFEVPADGSPQPGPSWRPDTRPRFPEFPEMYAPKPSDFAEFGSPTYPEYPEMYAPQETEFQEEYEPQQADFAAGPPETELAAYEPQPGPSWRPDIMSPQPGPSWRPDIMSPQPGPSWRPDTMSPPRQKSPAEAIKPEPEPCGATPKIKKYVKTAVFEQSRYDPRHPEESTKISKGKTFIKFNEPQQVEAQPVVTPPQGGVAVYPTSPPSSGRGISPYRKPPQVLYATKTPPQQTPPSRILPREQVTPTSRREFARTFPRRKLYSEELGYGRNVTGLVTPPRIASPPMDRRGLMPHWPEARLRDYQESIGIRPEEYVCPGETRPGMQVEQSFEEEEEEYIPEHLRGFKWVDEELQDW